MSAIADTLPAMRGLYYGGAWHETKAGGRIDAIDPATGEALGGFADAGSEDIAAAVGAARAAAPAWRDTDPYDRALMLRALATRVSENAERFALVDTLDAGLPIRAARKDVVLGLRLLDFFAGLVTELKGETIPTGPGRLNYTLREPLGVVARLIAFNHPLMFALSKLAAPLAAGNTLILKPSELTSLSALLLAEIAGDIFPAGVFNLVTGGAKAGAALSTDAGVDAVTLIGGIPTGRRVQQQAAGTLKRTLLELGGKNAFIVYPDADLDAAIDAAVAGMNAEATAGQSCGSTTRLFVHSSVYDRVVKGVGDKVARFTLALPRGEDTQVGCLVSAAQRDRVLAHVAAAKEEGARLLCGGGVPDDPALAGGFFVQPAVFADVTDDMRIAREEVFGPVLSILRWDEEDDMLGRANALEYGLTAAIWTRDLATAHRAAGRLQAGYIWINDVSSHFVGTPFGGVKQSGIGREECLDELYAFTEAKNVNVRFAAG